MRWFPPLQAAEDTDLVAIGKTFKFFMNSFKQIYGWLFDTKLAWLPFTPRSVLGLQACERIRFFCLGTINPLIILLNFVCKPILRGCR
jgi:hypothetical protein